MSIADYVAAINAEKQAQRLALEDRGIDMTGVPFTDYHSRIAEIKGGGGDGAWARPSDRPPVPVIGETEQVMYWLFGVQEQGPNDYAIRLTTSAGQYRAEWGDGTQDDYDSNTTAEHMYDYAAIPGTPNAQGYKWVWIKMYPLTGNITAINVNVRHSLRPAGSSSNIFIPQVFEWYMRAPYVTTFAFSSEMYTRYMLLGVFDYRGMNLITRFSYFAYEWRSLKMLIVDTSSSTDFNHFLYSCSSFNHPLNIDTRSGTDFSYFLSNCSSFNHPLNIDTRSGTNFSYFLYNCYSFNQSVTVDLAAATTAIGTSFIGGSCRALTGLRLLNMGTVHTTLAISYSNLDVPALVALFGDLADRTATTAGTIAITGVYGAARLTPEQRAIATAKNWTIGG